jgi:D-3-phosphoglycerate dehydrogenase
MPLILVTEPIADVGLRLLADFADVRKLWSEGRRFTDDDLRQADALIVRLVPVTASLMEKAAKLKVIGRHGAGVDTIDLPAATQKGIRVVYTPCANANAVAEHTLNLVLSLARHTVAGDHAVRQSGFTLRDTLIGLELRNKTLGIVGLGAIGLRVADIGHHGFGMKVVGYDPYAKLPSSHSFVQSTESLRQLLETSDVVSLHAPLTPGTQHMINAESLHWMKRSALLVNTSRGAVIDTVALAEALGSGELGGAALDVFEKEPLAAEHPLQSAQRVLFSPHLAGSTREAREAMAQLVARQVVQVLKGEPPEHLANPQVDQ